MSDAGEQTQPKILSAQPALVRRIHPDSVEFTGLGLHLSVYYDELGDMFIFMQDGKVVDRMSPEFLTMFSTTLLTQREIVRHPDRYRHCISTT